MGIIGTVTVISINAKDGCSFGDRGEMMRDFKDGFKIKGIFRELNLNDEQRETIKLNRKDMIENMKSQRDSADSINFITIDGVDKEKMINSAVEKAKSIAIIKADFLDKNFRVLTTEQKEEFIQLLND